MKIELVDLATIGVALFFLLAYLRIGLFVFLFVAIVAAAAEIFVQAWSILKKEN